MKRLLILLLLIPTVSFAQLRKVKKDVERRLTSMAEYLSLEIPKDTLDEWVTSVSKAEDTTIENPIRVKAWQRFMFSLYDHLGTKPGGIATKQSLANWANFMTTQVMRGRIYDINANRKTTPDDELGEVHVTGNGKETLVLIPPIGFGWQVFEKFIAHYKDRYQIVAITFPGTASSPPYAFPDQRSPAEGKWLQQVANNSINELKSRGIQNYYLVTMGSGNFTGMNIATKVGNQVKGIININGAFTSWLADPEDKELRASKEYREESIRAAFPSSLIVELTPNVFTNFMDFTKESDLQQKYMSHITTEQIPYLFQYLNEYNGQDLYGKMSSFSTPMLNLLSVYDDKSNKASSKGTVRFWQEVENDFPNLNTTNIQIPDTRDAAFIDQPDLTYYYIDAFLANPTEKVDQITGNRGETTLAKPSLSAGIRQTFGAIEVALDYHRPSVKGRTIFGELVPYGQIWRAGANEATTISFSNDVQVNGVNIPKGTYGLFMLPEKDKWQVVFNKINGQWGAFNYRSQYDQARINLTPSTGEFTELLTYSFENPTAESMDINLSWERTNVSFRVSEAFELPMPPQRIKSFEWNKVLTDGSGDGMNPGLSDGKSLSYYVDQKEDMLWFKFDLHGSLDPNAFAMNILIDTDADQETGMNWFGTNTEFTFEKCLTLWMRREGKTYAGINGITDQSGIYASEWNRLKKNNLVYYLDGNNNTYTVGVSLSDLDIQNNKVNIIGAVGNYMTWNDDIGDKEYATIELRK